MRVSHGGSGQVLVFFALVLPLVLLPLAAYAIDAAVAAAAYSELVEVTTLAAEDAAQQVDLPTFRSSGVVEINGPAATAVAVSEVEAAAGARLTAVGVKGNLITVEAAQQVRLPLDFVGDGTLTLHASATARIARGYDRPSSRLPLPVRTF